MKHKTKVLIVDDEATARYGIRKTLDTGCDVFEAANLESAKKTLETESPDIVLLDLNLGGENGLDLLGTTVEVLVEGTKKGRWYGRTRSDKLVFFDDERDMRGCIVDIEVKKADWFKLNFRGNTIINFDGAWNKFNGAPYSGDYHNPYHHQLEVIIDKGSLEAFIGNGRLVISNNLEEPKSIEGLKFFSAAGDGSIIKLNSLEVNELKSIWQKPF